MQRQHFLLSLQQLLDKTKLIPNFGIMLKAELNKREGFGQYLDRTLKKISGTYLRAFQTHQIDLTIEQWVILQQIYLANGNASQAEITKLNFRNRATTSRVISGLCKKGLVKKERFNGDLKRFKLTLTPEGAKVVGEVLPIAKNLRAIGSQHINDQDFFVFMKVLDQIWHNYHDMEEYWEKG